jgi:predicted Kef-type K+ transport protein
MKPLLAHLLYFWPLCAVAAWVVGAYQVGMMLQQWHSEARRKYGLSSRDAFALFFLSDIFADVSRRRKMNIAMRVFLTFSALQVITYTVLYSITRLGL